MFPWDSINPFCACTGKHKPNDCAQLTPLQLRSGQGDGTSPSLLVLNQPRTPWFLLSSKGRTSGTGLAELFVLPMGAWKPPPHYQEFEALKTVDMTSF